MITSKDIKYLKLIKAKCILNCFLNHSKDHKIRDCFVINNLTEIIEAFKNNSYSLYEINSSS